MQNKELINFIKDAQAGPAGSCRKTLQKGNAADFTTGDNGTISGYFSIFAKPMPGGRYEGKVDSYGDIVDPHCFDKTIKRRRELGKPWPLLYNHDFNQIIGRVTDIRPDSKGAFFTAEFFPTERAQEIRAICAANTLFSFSWAYDVIKQEKVTLTDGTRANCLQEVELYEVTITGIPAEPRAQMTDIKQAEGARSPEADRLLSVIRRLEEEDEEKKRDLDRRKREMLQVIDKMTSTDKAAQLQKLKGMETQALADIARADENGTRDAAEWKAHRQSALKEIRKEIKKLESAKA